MSSRYNLPFADVGSGIKPSSGAKLFFFETDGVTPKDTFSDQLATPTPNANPVIADSNGVFGDIFIVGEYKNTLKDKNDVQIFGGVVITEASSVASTDAHIDRLNPDTLAIWQDDTSALAGDVVTLQERSTGKGGGWTGTVVTGQTPNLTNIIAHNTLPLQLKLKHDGTITATQAGLFEGTNITSGIISLMANNDFPDVFIDGTQYNIDENWPFFPVNGKIFRGTPNLTTLTYVGPAGADANNIIEVIKLRTAARDPISNSTFRDFIIDLNNIDFVRGISLVYFINQSIVWNNMVTNVAAGSEGIVLDKIFYTNFGKLSVRNNPTAKTGKGIIFRGTVDGLSSINGVTLSQVTLLGLSDNLLFDTTTAAINSVNVTGTSESATNGATHVGVLGVTEANINLHMEGNLRNVLWHGLAGAGPGNITWDGVWNDTNTGNIKLGHSDHTFRCRTIGTINLFKWGLARVATRGAVVVDQGGTGGTEDVGAVTYTFIEDVSNFPGWRTSRQSFTDVTKGNWIKGASANSLTTTTGFVEFDFTDDIKLLSGYSTVSIIVGALRPDGSRLTFTALAYKRPADTVLYILEQLAGDALTASFEVELTVAGTLRVKTAINELILYTGRVDPL